MPSEQAVEKLLSLVAARSHGDSPVRTREAFQRALGDLQVPQGDPAWTDGSDVLGAAYEAAIPGEFRRQLGQFFTPIGVGRVMARWLLEGRPLTILDPGCGSGSLLMAAAHEKLGRAELLGLDIDPLAVEMTEHNGRIRGISHRLKVRVANFLNDPLEFRPDAIICNPPYTRHHDMEPEAREVIHRGFEERLGISVQRTASLHVLFLLRALEVTTDDARLAFITPSSWLDGKYARPVKEFLLSRAHVEAIIKIPGHGRDLVFDHAITSASLTFIQKKLSRRSRKTSFIRSETSSAEAVAIAVQQVSTTKKMALVSDQRWSGPPRRTYQGPRIDEVAEIHRGIATGCNEFFVLSEERRRLLRLARCSVVPCVPKPRLYLLDLVTNSRLEALPPRIPRWLLSPKRPHRTGPLAEYLAAGIKQYSVLDRRLVQDRARRSRPWYEAPELGDTPILMSYVNHGSPRFVRNLTNAVALNNWLIIRPKHGIPLDTLYRVLTNDDVGQSLVEQARDYGKGMWKLEPRELGACRLPRGRI